MRKLLVCFEICIDDKDYVVFVRTETNPYTVTFCNLHVDRRCTIIFERHLFKKEKRKKWHGGSLSVHGKFTLFLELPLPIT